MFPYVYSRFVAIFGNPGMREALGIQWFCYAFYLAKPTYRGFPPVFYRGEYRGGTLEFTVPRVSPRYSTGGGRIIAFPPGFPPGC